MSKVKKSFELIYDKTVSNLLYKNKLSLVLSTYQAGKVVFLSAPDPNSLIQLPRNFNSPMGIAFDKNRFAVATKTEITTFGNMDRSVLLKRQNKYDACFIPTATFYTGYGHVHDLAFGNDRLYAVNTNFSVIGSVNIDYNFTPYWKPSFIDEINSNDQCHLNGMALVEGKPKYATAFAQTSLPKGWRETNLQEGIFIDIENNEILLDNIFIPHSPRVHKDKIYFLESATSKLKILDLKTSKADTVVKLDGFVRGLDFFDDYAFVGISKIRSSSKTFGKLDISKSDHLAGTVVVELSTKKIVGYIKYTNSVNEIYDVKVLPNIKRATIVGLNTEDQFNVISMPDSGFWID